MVYSDRDEVALLVINDVDHVDSGRYKCEAVNVHGKADTACRLTVNSKNLHLLILLLIH